MALVKHLKIENIHARCRIETKEALLDYLAWLAAASGIPVPQKELKNKLLEREKTMSTGIGNGVCIPHSLVSGIDGLQAFVITLQEPIQYDSIDGEPVLVVVGLFGTPAGPKLSLRTLATLGRIFRDTEFAQVLWEAREPETIYQLLSDKEHEKY